MLKPPVFIRIAPRTIDDFGDLCQLREEFAPTERAYKACHSALATLIEAEGADAETELTAAGERWTLNISARGMERKINVVAVRKRLGAADFLKCCSVTLKALGRFLTQPEVDKLAPQEQTGARTIKAVALAQ